ncbi:MAG TPA: DUF4440 domain-containing protein [Steroidobacteraceae bacterium]|nr:DUF4440 domain-containing protein [Steroidobacteraceae bacterium]
MHIQPWRAVIGTGAAFLATVLLVPAAAADPPEVSAAAAAAISDANAQWLPAMKRGDVAAIVAPYADDALFVTARGDTIRGRAAIAELYRQRLAAIAGVVAGDLVSDGRVAATPELVYEWGHAALVLAHQDGSHSRGGGPYLTVWQRDGAGHWRIIRNVVF